MISSTLPILCALSGFLAWTAHCSGQRLDTWRYDLKDGNLASQTEPWTAVGASIRSPGKGFQFTYPKAYSALKNFTVEAVFDKLDGGPDAAVGIHMGTHVGVPLNGWNFLYSPASGTFQFEFRTPQETKVLAKKADKADFPLRLKLDIDNNAKHWRLTANGREIFDIPTGSLPVLWETGVCSLDGTAECSGLCITAGDIWKPVIAAGDSITHHCNWTPLAASGSGVAIGNAGMASDTSSGLLERFDSDVVRLHPKCAVLFVGTNDPKADTVFANYPVMLDRLQAAGIQPIFCAALPRQGWDKIDKINAFLRKLAADRRIPFVDWHDALQGPPGHLDSKYCLNGPVHPNMDGVRIMVDLFLADPGVAKIFQVLKTASGPSATP